MTGTVINLPCVELAAPAVDKVETVAFSDTILDDLPEWSVLVDPDKLDMLAGRGATQILDIRSEKARAKGAIDGTINIPYGAWRGPRENPGQPPSDAQLSQIIGAAGLRLNQPIVIMHSSAAAFDTGRAAYIYWLLKSLGADQVALLPGGFSALEPKMAEATFNLPPIQSYEARVALSDHWHASFDEVQGIAAGTRPGQLLDARPSKMFRATTDKPTTLPGALNGPIDQTHAALGAAPRPWAILSMMKGQRVNWQNVPVVSFCSTGELGALSWFYASEVSGIEDVKLYPESIKGWTTSGADLARPTLSEG